MTDLQAPGAGLPPFELAWLNGMFRVGRTLLSDRRAMAMFLSEGRTIVDLIEQTDIDFASQQVLVPRYPGMEDSSRNWSLLMVLDHLCRVDREILRTIDVLRDGIVPRGEIDIADYKPDPDVDARIIDEFLVLVNEYETRVTQLMPLKTQARFPHPWFGLLDAHGWHCLAAVHHRIHRRQARKIATLQGLT